jgi:hypothetical protein
LLNSLGRSTQRGIQMQKAIVRYFQTPPSRRQTNLT